MLFLQISSHHINPLMYAGTFLHAGQGFAREYRPYYAFVHLPGIFPLCLLRNGGQCWTLSMLVCIWRCLEKPLVRGHFWSVRSELPPGLGGVRDRSSPGELAPMMNGHLSILYCSTKSYNCHVFITHFCCFFIPTPFFGIKLQTSLFFSNEEHT